MKYLAMAIVLISISSSAFAHSDPVKFIPATVLSPFSTFILTAENLKDPNHKESSKNISEAQKREDIIKANLDEKSDSKESSEQKSEE